MRKMMFGALCVAVASVTVVAGDATGAGAANNSEQVVFSIHPQFVTGSLNQPTGFWVWCEADSTNPYAGRCNGNMYFYNFGGGRHVSGTITEPEEHIYDMHLRSDDGSIACTLENQSSVSGPHNDVNMDCTAPVPGAGTAHDGVVNVTGP